MPKIPRIILDKKHFLLGLSSGGYNQDGLFRQSYTQGIDIFRSKDYYGMLQQGYKYTELDPMLSVMKDVDKWFVQKDSDFYGYGNNGHLYKFPLVTTPPAPSYTPVELDSSNYSGRAGGRGLIIYNDGTSDKLHYFGATTIGTFDFASTYNNSYKTGLTDAPHPAKEWQGVLYFGNGRYVGSLNGTTLNLTALTLPVGYEVQDIDIYGNYIAILAFKSTGALNTECKLYLWDTYLTGGVNFEYVVPEKAYSLEKYKDGLAIFGYNIRLFGVSGYMNFDIIHNIESTTVYPGQTCYSNNTLYWQEYGFLGSFGSPNSRIKASLQAPLTNTGQQGAIINLNTLNTQFLISRNDKYVNTFNDGYSGGYLQTINIELPVPSRLRNVTFVFEKLANGDGFEMLIYDDNGLSLSKNVTYDLYGAIAQKSFTFNSKVTSFFHFNLNFGSADCGGNPIIKKIIIDYQPTELKDA